MDGAADAGDVRDARGWMLRRGSVAVGVLALMAFVPAFLLQSRSLLTAIAVLAAIVLSLAAPWLFRWRTLLYGVVLAVLVVPANLYRLPAALPVDVEIYRILLLALIALWGAALLVDPSIRLRSTRLDAPIYALLTAIGISLLVNLPDLGGSLLAGPVKRLFYMGSLVLLLYAIVSVVRTEPEARRLVTFVIAVGGIVAAFGMLERFTGFNAFRQLHRVIPLLRPTNDVAARLTRAGGLRIAGSAAHPIAFSAILGMLVPLSLARLSRAETSRAQLVYAATAGVTVLAMILTGSRTAFVALAAAMVVLIAGQRKGRGRMLVVTAIGFLVVYMALPGTLGTLFKWISPSFIYQREIGNDAGRVADYPKVKELWALRPAFGMGFGVFTASRFFFVDNQYLKLLVELGLVGLSAFAWLLARSVRWFYSSARRLAEAAGATDLLGIAGSVTVFAVVTATFDTIGFPQVTYLFFILLGLGAALALTAPVPVPVEYDEDEVT